MVEAPKLGTSCPWINEALAAKKDPHTFVASKMFGIPEAEVLPAHRAIAKQRNFVFLYSNKRNLKEIIHG